MIISAWNPETDELEKTNLGAVVSSGSSSLTVKNADRFAINQKILIGEMGMEQTEVATIAGSGLTTTLIPLSGNTKFGHTFDEPVYLLRYDQLLFYRSDAQDGTYDLIHSTEIDADNRDNKTYYDDLTSSPTSWYKTKFRNSVTMEETDFSDPIAATGAKRNSIGKVIDVVTERISDKGFAVLSIQSYLDLATEVNDDILGQSEKPYSFMRKSIYLDRVAGQNYIDLPEDYYKFRYFEATDVQGWPSQTKELNPIPLRNFRSGYGASANSNIPTRIAIDDEERKLYISPAPRTNSTGAYRLWYYTELEEFTDVSQEVKTPNSLIYKYKFLAEAYRKKAEVDPSFGQHSATYEQKYGNELMKLQRSNKKDVGTPRDFMSASVETSAPRVSPRRYTLNG